MKITPLKMWVQNVLPVVYDDSLSYYEMVGKINEKTNEIINQVNENTEDIEALNEIIEQLGDVDELTALLEQVETIVNDLYTTDIPAMDSENGSAGVAEHAARSDHSHPSDSSKADSDLGITGALAGQFVKIKSVEAGVPTEFENGMPHEIPSGGTTGQALRKESNGDYAVDWGDVHEIPSGGNVNNILVKNSSNNFDVGWTNTPAQMGSLAYINTGSTADKLYKQGEYFVWNGQLYKVKDTTIAQGGTLTPDGNIEAINVTDCLNLMVGKNIVWIGDSYVQANSLGADQNKRFSTLVSNALNLTEFNFAVGGSDYLAPSGSTYPEQLDNAISAMSAEQKTYTKYVVIAGCRNVPYNTPSYTLSQLNSAFQSCLTKAKNNFPNAKIVIIPMLWDYSPLNATYQSLLGNMEACCAANSWNGFYIKPSWTWLIGKHGAILSDGVHPNAAGHENIATQLINAFNGSTQYPQSQLLSFTAKGVTIKIKLINNELNIAVSGNANEEISVNEKIFSTVIGANAGILTGSNIFIVGTDANGNVLPLQFAVWSSSGNCLMELQYIGASPLTSGTAIRANTIIFNGLQY